MITIQNLKTINEAFQYMGYPDYESADLETYDAIFEAYVCEEANQAVNEGVLGTIGNAIIAFFKKIAELFMAIVSKIASFFGGSSSGGSSSGGGSGDSSGSSSGGSSSTSSGSEKTSPTALPQGTSEESLEIAYCNAREYTDILNAASNEFTRGLSKMSSGTMFPEILRFMLNGVTFEAAKTKKPEACVSEFTDTIQKIIKNLKNSEKEDEDKNEALKIFNNMRDLVMGDYHVLDSASPAYDARVLKEIISSISDGCQEIRDGVKSVKTDMSQGFDNIIAGNSHKKKITDKSKAINEINQAMPIIKKDVSMLSAQSKDYSDLASRMAKSEEAAQSKYANMNQELIKSLTSARLIMWKSITTMTYTCISLYLMVVRKLYTVNRGALSKLNGRSDAKKWTSKKSSIEEPSTPKAPQ